MKKTGRWIRFQIQNPKVKPKKLPGILFLIQSHSKTDSSPSSGCETVVIFGQWRVHSLVPTLWAKKFIFQNFFLHLSILGCLAKICINLFLIFIKFKKLCNLYISKLKFNKVDFRVFLTFKNLKNTTAL